MTQTAAIERAVEARMSRVMYAIQAGLRTARHYGYPKPPTPPPLDVIRRAIVASCERDAAAGLLEREVAHPCRQCLVVHNISDHCPLKRPAW